jgi:hypothetical protein
MKKIFLIWLSIVLMMLFPFVVKSQNLSNLLQNPEFKSKDNNIPDGWKWFLDKNVIHIISGENVNIVEISEDTDKYVPSICTTLKLDGFKTYQFSVDVKTEEVSKNAAVYYYWTDANGKEITKEQYIIKLSGTKDWQTVKKIISPENPAETKGLKIVLAIYGAKGGKGKVWFKNPCLIEVSQAQEQKKN